MGVLSEVLEVIKKFYSSMSKEDEISNEQDAIKSSDLSNADQNILATALKNVAMLAVNGGFETKKKVKNTPIKVSTRSSDVVRREGEKIIGDREI